MDKIQIRISNVTFQLDLELPLEASTPEPVSFQITFETLNVEGVTMEADELGSSAFAHKEGKRNITLSNIRASLISRANVFSALAPSPSMASPSVVSSPTSTRNPPSRETSSMPDAIFSQHTMTSPHSVFGFGASHRNRSPEPDATLADSEEALDIPYDLPGPQCDGEDETPATPRASVYHDMDEALSSAFRSASSSRGPLESPSRHATGLAVLELTAPERVERLDTQFSTSLAEAPGHSGPDNLGDSSRAMPTTDGSEEPPRDELSQSRIYTHEEAESMYMSALSQTGSIASSQTAPNQSDDETDRGSQQPQQKHRTARQSMPGGWNDYSEGPAEPNRDVRTLGNAGSTASLRPTTPKVTRDKPSSEGSPGSSPASFKASPNRNENEEPESSGAGCLRGGMATPKGPTQLVKEICSLKQVSIYLPSRHQHLRVDDGSFRSISPLSGGPEHSVYPQAPGAFSVHDGALPITAAQAPVKPATATESSDNVLDVLLSPIDFNLDASVGLLLAAVASRFLDALQSDHAAGSAQSQDAKDSSHAAEVKVIFEEMTLNFLNRLCAVADTPGLPSGSSAFPFDNDILLGATIQNLVYSLSYRGSTDSGTTQQADREPLEKVTRLDVERFQFGYADGNILSFDHKRPMSTSIQDTFLSAGCDVSINIVQTAGKIRADIETLPLAVQIDLQRLDETFGWFGGLSSFLNMSTSRASAHSLTPAMTSHKADKPRGVRFETPIVPEDTSVAGQSKLNLRVGGAMVELIGKECSVAAETSAIKLVSRDEGIGASISRIRASGPYGHRSKATPAITTEVAGLRLDFLPAPKNADLEKLLELITPSKVKFDDENDEIMVDTLLRQRRQGSVLRLNSEKVNFRVQNVAQLTVLPNLGVEIAKLATVARYLPEDDRPGLLTLGKIFKLDASADFGGKLGLITTHLQGLDVAHITIPSLFALAVQTMAVVRNESEELVSSMSGLKDGSTVAPVIMARIVGEEMEPVTKVKLRHLAFEYRVPTVMDILDLEMDSTPQDFEESLAASVANLGNQAHAALARELPSKDDKARLRNPMKLDIGLQDCAVGLNPLNLPSKMLVALADAHLEAMLPAEMAFKAKMEVRKASILLTDDISQIHRQSSRRDTKRSSSTSSRQVAELCSLGYVDVCYISSAMAQITTLTMPDGSQRVEVELRDDLLVLETCADSTQTLVTLVNALKPPTPPSKEIKYKTSVMPVQNLLASISAEAFGNRDGEFDFDQDFAGAQELAGSVSESGEGSEHGLHIDSRYYGSQAVGEEIFNAMTASGTSTSTNMQGTAEGVLLTGFNPTESQGSTDGDELVFQEGFYSTSTSDREHSAKIWNSNKNTYDKASVGLVERCPLKVSARDVHVIWNLFDGYDWTHTRDVINKAVKDVEQKALERQPGPPHGDDEDGSEEAISDFLFNSIYIGIPANRDPEELAGAIADGLNDNATETESTAPTSVATSTNRTARPHQIRSKRLRLSRSRHHKITFELRGVDLDLYSYAPGSETTSSTDLRIQNLEIFDHVPTSTWKKFATYDRDNGEREMGTSMVHLEFLDVKPIPELGASETVMRATVLPLRLHVDQDALDFITRFFEFKDENVPVHSSKSDIPFIQRAEINSIPVKLDFKPKRVDYVGLRSGHTTEFMNFIVLEEARMVLRHVIIYGISGFDRLGKTLNDIWMPDVRTNQLPGVVAGLAPVRSLVNIGSGFRNLIEIPLKEYQKDGRVVRSISKGAAAFARTTGTELVKLGAKLAVGTQYALQGAEGLLLEQRQQHQHQTMPQTGQSQLESGWESDELETEGRKQISLYAEQPTGVIQGIRGGYRSLARDVNLARDAIIAVPGEVMESQSASGAAQVIFRRAPTIIFRPAVGVSKAIGQTFMGATNAIDPQNRRRIDDVSFTYFCVCVFLTCGSTDNFILRWDSRLTVRAEI